MLCSILWFSVTHQESAIVTSMSPPSRTSLPSPSLFHPSRLSQSLCLSSLSHTVNSHWLSILYTYYKFPCYSLYTSYPLPPPLSSPHHVHRSVLYCCPEIKFISAIFLDYMYMCQFMIFIFLFLTYFTLYNGP